MAFYLINSTYTIIHKATRLTNDTNALNWTFSKDSVDFSSIHDQKGHLVFDNFDFPTKFTGAYTKILSSWGRPVSKTIEEIKGDTTLKSNEKAFEKTQKYIGQLLVVWPKAYELEILIDLNPLIALQEFHRRIIEFKEPIDKKIVTKLDNLITRLNETYTINSIFPQNFVKCFEILKAIDNVDYVVLFARKVLIRTSDCNDWVLAKLVAHFGFDRLQKTVQNKLKSKNPVKKNRTINLVFNCLFLLVRFLNPFAIFDSV